MVNSSLCFLAALLPERQPQKISADSSLKIGRGGAVGRSAQGRGLLRMETWSGELKPAGLGPEVHLHRLPRDTLFCLKINQAKGRSISTLLSNMRSGNHKDRAFLHHSLNLFSSARKAEADALGSGLRVWRSRFLSVLCPAELCDYEQGT